METPSRRLRRASWVVVTATVFVAAGWLLVRHAGPTPAASASSHVPRAPIAGRSSPVPASSDTEASHLADELNAPGGTIRRDLQIVTDVLEAYRTNLPHTGNPVGDNAEITAALTGRNRLHLALISPRHPAINAAGELCDRWGTPFFFHAESGRHMTIRSAGPDRRMWTADDIVSE